jgi:hypothetical protein
VRASTATGTRWKKPLSPAGSSPAARICAAMNVAARSEPGVPVPRPCMESSASDESTQRTSDSCTAESTHAGTGVAVATRGDSMADGTVGAGAAGAGGAAGCCTTTGSFPITGGEAVVTFGCEHAPSASAVVRPGQSRFMRESLRRM